MASHMRTDDTPTTQRVVSHEDDGRHLSNQVIDEGVRVEAQDVRSSRKYFYTPDRGKAARTKHSHHHHRSRGRKRGGCLKPFLTLLGILLVLGLAVGGAGYVYGKQLYASARTVKSLANEALAQGDVLKDAITAGDYAKAHEASEEMASIASEMKQETDGDLWKLASRVPVYGGDVAKVRTMSSVFVDLSRNALIPLTQDLTNMDISAIIGTEGKIDVNSLVELANALGTVSDVISRNAEAVDSLGEAKLEQVNEPLQKVRTMLVDLDVMTQGALKVAPVLPQMLGADGQTRYYLVIAQNNAEVRATGGYPGAWGQCLVTDGKLSMEDMFAFARYRAEAGRRPEASEDEYALFGDLITVYPGNANLTPDWSRAAQKFAFFWEDMYGLGYQFDGVIGIDPIFLQIVLKYVGGITASNGWEINGDNAAEVLMNDIYLSGMKNAEQDAFFQEFAKQAFDKFTSNIGTIGITNISQLLQEAASSRRFVVWMRDESAQSIMRELGVTGELEYDPEEPVLGVYVNDDTWAKMCWYMDLHTQVEESTINANGSKTYRVTTTIANTMSEGDLYNATKYVYGNSPSRRNDGDLSSNLLLYAPAGGSISNIQFSDNCNMNGYREATYNGLQVIYALVNTNYEETTTVTYTVTTAPEARGDLQVRMTPTCRSFE